MKQFQYYEGCNFNLYFQKINLVFFRIATLKNFQNYSKIFLWWDRVLRKDEVCSLS